jgi:DNA replicative helicase MCM subunit Mcm2 (Cdc46/Mcm family)
LDLFGCKTLEELSKKGIVDRHPGTPKFHMTIFTDGELENLPTNDSGVELKGSQKLTTVSHTRYEDGTYRELVGDSLNTMGSPVPIPHEKFMYTLHEKLLPFGVNYLNGKANGYNPVSRNKQKIPNGQRHTKLVSYANSLIARLHKTTNMQTIQRFFDTYNNEECEVPLPVQEVDQIFSDAWNNIGKSTTNNNSSQQKQENTDKVLSVLEAKRLHSGYITVIGTIVSVTDMYILENKNKDTIEYNNAKSIKLEDIDKMDYNERLDVLLYNDMVNNVVVGETVKITGNMRVEDKKPNSKSKKKFNVLHANSITYLNRKEVFVTEEDKEIFKKFVTDCRDNNWNLMDKLTIMFAPNIIGRQAEKRGILRSIVGGVNHSEKNDGRISTLMVGDSGTAKSELGKEAVKIKPRSRHVSAPHATTKTIIAVPERMPDGTATLIIGAVPLATGAICSIDEVNSFSMDDQSRILDVLDNGGKVSIDKMGIRCTISALTTIIATANPLGGKWDNPQVATRQEVDIRRNLMDRITQLYTSRGNMTEQQTKNFVGQMNIIRKRRHNYNFLGKYLIYASSINDLKFTKEAENKLGQFWADGKTQGLLSIRMYDGIFKMAEAQAKLHLKNVVDLEIANEVIEDIKLMMVDYGEVIRDTLNPHEVAYNTCLEILKKSKVGMDIKPIRDLAVKENDQVASYLGDIWQIDENIRLRGVMDSLENHPNIKRVKSHPIVLQWLTDITDITDTKTKNKIKQIDNNIVSDTLETENNISQTISATSATSDRTYPPKCYYCDEYFDGMGKQAYENHVINKHPKKPCYPGLADIDLYRLTAQDMKWEAE